MNEWIDSQLKSVKYASIPDYDDSTGVLLIKKVGLDESNTESQINLGDCIRVQVENYIVNPYDGFTFHDNWNGGTHPIDVELDCQVLDKTNKMIKVHSIGRLTRAVWDGWLPIKSCKFLN